MLSNPPRVDRTQEADLLEAFELLQNWVETATNAKNVTAKNPS